MIPALLALAILAAPGSPEPLKLIHGRLFIAATVNGRPSEALLDSGAESSLVDRDWARAAGLALGPALTIKGSGGTQEAHVASGVTIAALGQTLANRDVVVLDLQRLAWLVRHPTSVIVGRELFDAAAIEVDMQRGTIRALPAGEKGKGSEYPLTPHAGIEALRVFVNGVPADADLDLGNGSDVLVSKAMAERLHLRALGPVRGGGIGGPIIRQRVVLRELNVGGRTFRQVPAQIDALPTAGELNIGTAILRHFLVTADFGHDRVWLKPYSSENP